VLLGASAEFQTRQPVDGTRVVFTEAGDLKMFESAARRAPGRWARDRLDPGASVIGRHARRF